ncbi:uncharacterized protein LOC131022905 [Salvia miltiorrhiza]|uniref:uncharacterized protein LOC131022905 n=1 Tax=Salvia miltiorrhiza TaxID=226208 RepID=UPI0025AB8255|nr:uncharacterized protein LOC131022905 [Salvia miltiorrhiza]
MDQRLLRISVCGKELELGPPEFHVLTGLSFNGWEQPPSTSLFFKKHFQGVKKITFSQLREAFQKHCTKLGGVDDDALRFALLIILYGVLWIKHSAARVEESYMHLVDDLERFDKFPWGLVAYEFLVLVSHNNRIKLNLQKKNKKGVTVEIQGFGYALQLFAYEMHNKIGGLCATRLDEAITPRMLRWAPVPHKVGRQKIQALLKPTFASDLNSMQLLPGELENLQAAGIAKGVECRVPLNEIIHFTKKTQPLHTLKKHQNVSKDDPLSSMHVERRGIHLPKRSTRAAHSVVDITDRELFSKRGLRDIQAEKQGNIEKKETKKGKRKIMEKGQISSPGSKNKRKKVALQKKPNVPPTNEPPLNDGQPSASQQGNLAEATNEPPLNDGQASDSQQGSIDENLKRSSNNKKMEKGTNDCQTKAETKDCQSKPLKNPTTKVPTVSLETEVVATEVVDCELITDEEFEPNQSRRKSSRLKRPRPLKYGLREGPYPLQVASAASISAFEAWYTSNVNDLQSRPLKGMPYVGEHHATWFEELWKPNGWHIDCLVNMNIAAFKRDQTGFLAKWTVVEQTGWNALCALTHVVLRSQLKPYVEGRAPFQLATPWWEAEKILGSAQVNRDHWVCYEIQIDKQQVTVYDSLSDTRVAKRVRKPFDQVLKNLAWICKEFQVWDRRSTKSRLKRVWDLKIHQHPPQQGNTTNCGIMALKYFECLITNRTLKVLHEDHGSEFRRSYCAQLFEYEV